MKIHTVAVISVTDKPLFLRNRCNNESTTLFLFWLLVNLPESSTSITNGSLCEQLEILRFDNRVIDLIDLTFSRKWADEEARGGDDTRARVAAKAASISAISSSLMISTGTWNGVFWFCVGSSSSGGGKWLGDCDSVILDELVPSRGMWPLGTPGIRDRSHVFGINIFSTCFYESRSTKF